MSAGHLNAAGPLELTGSDWSWSWSEVQFGRERRQLLVVQLPSRDSHSVQVFNQFAGPVAQRDS